MQGAESPSFHGSSSLFSCLFKAALKCVPIFSRITFPRNPVISLPKKVSIVSDGYIYIGIHSVSHGSSCFLILTGLPTNINVLRFYHIALYQADILRPVAFVSPGIPNFSRQSFSRFSTFSSK